MPAPDLATLLDVESQWDAALAAVLAPFAAAPYDLQVTTHETTDTLVTPRLEFEFTLTEPVGPEGQILIHPTLGCQLGYGGTLTFRHVYDHTNDSAATAAAFRGALRALLAPPGVAEEPALSATLLPWLAVDGLTEISAVRTRYRDHEKEKLLSEFLSTWSVSFHLLPAAFPVA